MSSSSAESSQSLSSSNELVNQTLKGFLIFILNFILNNSQSDIFYFFFLALDIMESSDDKTFKKQQKVQFQIAP